MDKNKIRKSAAAVQKISRALDSVFNYQRFSQSSYGTFSHIMSQKLVLDHVRETRRAKVRFLFWAVKELTRILHRQSNIWACRDWHDLIEKDQTMIWSRITFYDNLIDKPDHFFFNVSLKHGITKYKKHKIILQDHSSLMGIIALWYCIGLWKVKTQKTYSSFFL